MDLLLLLSWKMTSGAAGSCVCRLFQMGAGHSNLELLHSSKGPNAVFWKGNFRRQMWFPQKRLSWHHTMQNIHCSQNKTKPSFGFRMPS